MLRSTDFYPLDSDEVAQQDGAHGVGYSSLLNSATYQPGEFYLDVSELAIALHAKEEQYTQLNNLTIAERAHLWRACHDLAYQNRQFKPHGFTDGGNKRRSIVKGWFDLHQWLVCCKLDHEDEGLFCRDCLFFGNPKVCKGAYFYPQYRQYSKVARTAKSHEAEAHHKQAAEARQRLMQEERNGIKSVAGMIKAYSLDCIVANRAMLESVIRPLLFLCVQGLAIRGHRNETWSDVCSEFALEGNPGNYCALLRRLRHENTTLARVFPIDAINKGTRAARTSYHSPQSQNEIISIVAGRLRNRIVQEVKHSKWFSISCDEATDCTSRSQMVLCVRYIDAEHLIREAFLCFVELEDQTSDGLTNTILTTAQQLGLKMENCRGQGYDGCSTMAGCRNGAALQITCQYPAAQFFHCASHKLSLSIEKICKDTTSNALKDLTLFIDQVWLYFKFSPKRLRFLFENMEKYNKARQTSTRRRHLRGFSPTRWIQRIQCINDFVEFLCMHHWCPALNRQ